MPLTKRCADRTGFLFPHRCSRTAVPACSRCKRPVCEKHRFRYRNDDLCAVCAQKVEHPDWFSHPFFYGRRHYEGYGTFGRWAGEEEDEYEADADDFTEADDASTEDEGSGEEAFESDPGGS